MFIKIAQRNWATKKLSFVYLNGPAFISFSRKEYFHCKCTGNIFISGSLGIASIRSGSAQRVLFGRHPEIRDVPITLLMKSCTQMNPPSSLNITLLLCGHFQLSDYAGKTLCHKQHKNICKESLWKPLSKPKCTLGSEVHYLQGLTFSPITFDFFFFFIQAARGYMAREASQTRSQFIAVWRITESGSNSKTL